MVGELRSAMVGVRGRLGEGWGSVPYVGLLRFEVDGGEVFPARAGSMRYMRATDARALSIPLTASGNACSQLREEAMHFLYLGVEVVHELRATVVLRFKIPSQEARSLPDLPHRTDGPWGARKWTRQSSTRKDILSTGYDV